MSDSRNNSGGQGRLITTGVFVFIAFLVILIFSNATFLTIDSGSKGVLFKRFGGGLEKDKIYNQGFHVVAPWNNMIVYNVRIQEDFEEMSVLSKNGLTIDVDLSYRFTPVPGKIGYLHDEIGVDYQERIVIPEVRSATREVIGKYSPEELYSTQREAIQDEIFQRTAERLLAKNIVLDAILIREVALPAKLKEAIEKKLEEEQLALQFEFKLERERREAERKIIEARAKAEANEILNASLSDNILRDKGIEATLQLANSTNSKVIVVGSSENGGLPLILGNN